jgi:phosphoglycolate phosphatase
MIECSHIIWDWNGTLLDDTWLCLELINKQLQRQGLPVLSMETYRGIFDFPVADFYRMIGFDFRKIPYETIAALFHGDYCLRRFECSLHRGAERILGRAQSCGMRNSLLSAYMSSYLREMTGHYGLDNYFSHIVGLDNPYGKGKTEEGRWLIERLDCGAESVLMVGDSTHDYEVARELGVRCVLVAGGHYTRERIDSVVRFAAG